MQDLCREHIQPGKQALDKAEYTDPTQQHELLAVDHEGQESQLFALKGLDDVASIDYLPEVWNSWFQ